MDTKRIAGDAAREIIASLGFEMADVDYAREDGQMCLTFYLCAEKPIAIEDCEAVSRAIEDAVDRADPTGGKPYCLCVSSWGDRPLKTARDLERNKGKEVEVRLKKAEGKKKKFIGGLVAFDELTLTLSLKGEDKIFKREEMESVRPYIGF